MKNRRWEPYLKVTKDFGLFLYKLLLGLVGGTATLAALWAFHWLIEVASSFSHGGFVVILGVLGLVHETLTLVAYARHEWKETGVRCRRRKARERGGKRGKKRYPGSRSR